jgi:hypothetical protein
MPAFLQRFFDPVLPQRVVPWDRAVVLCRTEPSHLSHADFIKV